MSGLQTQTEGVAPDISVSDNPPSSNQDTPDVVEETVVVVPDDQVINDENIPLEAADQISPTMKPKTQKRITELVKRGHEKDSVIKEKEDRIKELESRMASVESKTNEREVKEGQAIAEATLANLQKQREEAFEEQDFKKANELDLHIYKAAAQVNKLPIDDFDVVKYFKEKNNWYGQMALIGKCLTTLNIQIYRKERSLMKLHVKQTQCLTTIPTQIVHPQTVLLFLGLQKTLFILPSQIMPTSKKLIQKNQKKSF